MKVCSQCGEEKALSEFYFNKRFGREVAACKGCSAKAKKAYALKNSEKLKVVARKWQKANPERVRAAQDRWRAKNPGLAAQRTAEWRAKNRERALGAQRLANRKLKDAAYAAYGGYRCSCPGCKETIEAFLSLDHVNNDGAEHRKAVDRRKIYKWLAQNNYPDGFQVLCMNCNFGKARNGGICPHLTQRSEGPSTIPRGSTAKRPEARGSSEEDEDIVRSRRQRRAVPSNGAGSK